MGRFSIERSAREGKVWLAKLLVVCFGPGWYVETNYSTKDRLALLYALKESPRG